MLIKVKKSAKKEDIYKIYDLVEAYYEEIDKTKLNRLTTVRAIRNNLLNKNHSYFYIKFQNKKIGLIHLYITKRFADLCLIYILPEFRNMGLGKSSLKDILNLLKRRGIKKLFIEISSGNKSSFNFFKKNLFKDLETKIKSYIYEVNLK
jgi:N-acetylglutamate synthase-like GNAT family acetyltransferase